MSLILNYTNLPLRSSFISLNVQRPSKTKFQILPLGIWKRKRWKVNPSILIRCNFDPLISTSIHNLFNTLFSRLVSVNSIDVIAPTLGFVVALSFYFSHQEKEFESSNFVSTRWILYTSPTTFNRFVFLRCPSISFTGNEYLEDLSETLVNRDSHFVEFNNIKLAREKNAGIIPGTYDVTYQRVCTGTKDGGVISLDWPANLDLKKEHGLDTILLLIPGTTEGSKDDCVMSFVTEALRYGYFPVVMNPRGCGGSPLTSARLFTSADSDDICTAIQFINRLCPHKALMSIGWGFGANMLAKYLGEVGENAPLTAAACIDNPFDLEESTRSYAYHNLIGKPLTDGLIEILRSNKELFQGKNKGFDVEKALSATCLREFEHAISMVSYECQTLENFYLKSSSKYLIGGVKVPLLFIQNEGAVPFLSIPHSSITENPFTSLLQHSFLQMSGSMDKSATPWCQNLVIEWFSAVELALLKGRHPLLNDIDVIINPSKTIALLEDKISNQIISKGNGINNKYSDHARYSEYKNKNDNGLSSHIPLDSMRNTSEKSENSTQQKDHAHTHAKIGLSENQTPKLVEHEENFNVSQTSISVDDESKEGDDTSQVLQTTEVVMNMLDATMPGILTDEEKKKVLTAVEQGETIVKALQGAVPEDVGGKLTSAASEILQSKGKTLNFHGLKKIDLMPNVALEVKSKIQETRKGISSIDHSLEGKQKDSGTTDETNGMRRLSSETGDDQTNPRSEIPLSLKSEESVEVTLDEDNENSRRTFENNSHPSSVEIMSETGVANKTVKDVNISNEIENASLYSTVDHNKGSSTKLEQMPSSTSESLEVREIVHSNHEGDAKGMQEIREPKHVSNPPEPSEAIGISQAFNALTVLDDSSQMAVNSVFGVIENIIDQMEEGKDVADEKKSKTKDSDSNTPSKKSVATSEYRSSKIDTCINQLGSHLDSTRESFELGEDQRHELCESGFPQSSDSTTISCNEKSQVNGDSDYPSNIGEGNEANPHSTFPLHLPDEMTQDLHSPQVHIVAVNPYSYLTRAFSHKPLLLRIPIKKSLDTNSTSDLFLEYFPEDGQWKLTDQLNTKDSVQHSETQRNIHRDYYHFHFSHRTSDRDDAFLPSDVTLDSETEWRLCQEDEIVDDSYGYIELKATTTEEVTCLVKNAVLNNLKVEVGRKLGLRNVEDIDPNLLFNLKEVVEAIARVVGNNREMAGSLKNTYPNSVKFATLSSESILEAISNVLKDAEHLRSILPLGVVVGCSLAALRKYFRVAVIQHDQSSNQIMNMNEKFSDCPQNVRDENLDGKGSMRDKEIILTNGGLMDSAVTTTGSLCASSSVHDQRDGMYDNHQSTDAVFVPIDGMDDPSKDNNKHSKHDDEVIQERQPNSIVSNLAEKAMSVASPVIPTKGDGEVDHERLVNMLANVGQKVWGLKLVGKIALLWGGFRGAVSLTDRLIFFMRIAERPLHQRILGFMFMTLVLWSPVAIPLLPTLFQNWIVKRHNATVEYGCILGLYVASMILVMLWGERIRGHENPIEQYGLDIKYPKKFIDFLKWFLGGVVLILLSHSINVLLGTAYVTWSFKYPSSLADAIVLVIEYGRIGFLAARGIVSAIGISIVEELLFRSWLPEEIAVDLSYPKAIILSSFVFALLQRSLPSIPGFWLLSLSLSWIKQRGNGSLYAPIGLHAGILSSHFVLRMSGVFRYKSDVPLWITGVHPWQPFGGAVSIALCFILALFLHPKQYLYKYKGLKDE